MISLYILIALQAADLITTILCLNTGKAREANGFLARMMGVLGVTPTLLLIKGAFIAILIWAAPQVGPGLLWLACLGYAWVVYNNLLVHRSLK